tara:strand:- start:2069 stop:2443 length:375 start_codon:yes stop_codon:yes gene_type:complete
MSNPFDKYLGKEDRMQNKVMNYIKHNYKNAVFTHISNEGKRSPFERYKMKILGSKAGVPDIMIFTPNKHYNGLAIELKVGYNKPSENQKIWLRDLEKAGWYATWSNNLDNVISTIDNYFENEKI